jgi:hypothetical protein
MNHSPLLISLPLLAAIGVGVLGSTACEKKVPPAPEAAAPPPAATDAAPVVLVPLDDSLDAGVDAGPAKPRGPYTPTNTNAARIKQCCAAMRSQAKNMGASPEANMMVQAAAACDMVALQVTATGTAPEFGQVRNMLKGRTLPAACSGM